jgi:hypothetical protein
MSDLTWIKPFSASEAKVVNLRPRQDQRAPPQSPRFFVTFRQTRKSCWDYHDATMSMPSGTK